MSTNMDGLLRSFSKQVWTVSFFFSHVLIPLGVLTFYFVSLSWLLPEGVSNVFVTRSGIYVLTITIVLWVAFFALVGLRMAKRPFAKPSGERLFAGDLILLLLPLTPVIQYVINNREILYPIESALIVAVFTLLAALLILIIPILLRRTGSTRTLVFLGLAFAFLITSMASLSRQFAWHEAGSLRIQMTIFGSVFLVSLILFHLNIRNLLYLLVAAYFLTNSVFQIPSLETEAPNVDFNETDNSLARLVESRDPGVAPSIYLLVYDAYVVNETMLAYGIDNQAQEQYLVDRGFQIYPHTYTIGWNSVSTMSRVLNASEDYYGDRRRGTSGDGIVHNLLIQYGYKTYGVFPTDHFFRGFDSSYDYLFPSYSSGADLLLRGIAEGEFRFDIDKYKVPRELFIQEKEQIFSEASDGPIFVYMHTNRPAHSQNSGACRPNEIELFSGRLSKANQEMRQDVERIIENDPEAIVIVAGDHGPYLTKNCFITDTSYDISEISRLDIQDRFGTFLAVRWPTEDYDRYDDIVVLQDLFPAIFAYLFQDPGLLESKVEPVTLSEDRASGAAVVNGVIEGGIDSGESLFTGGND